MQVLVTGGLGWTAEPLVLALIAQGHEVVALDLAGVEKPRAYQGDGVAVVRGDVTDLALVERVAAVCDAIVHLALDPEDDDSDGERPFAVNVRGTWNVFRAARDQAVETVVLMSAAPVHLAFGPSTRLDGTSVLPTSDGGRHLHDLTRLLQETIARNFAATFGGRTVVLRAGSIVDGKSHLDRRGEPLGPRTPLSGGLVCRHDLAAAVIAALSGPEGRLHVFGAVGTSPGREVFLTAQTEEALGVGFQRDGFEKVEA